MARVRRRRNFATCWSSRIRERTLTLIAPTLAEAGDGKQALEVVQKIESASQRTRVIQKLGARVQKDGGYVVLVHLSNTKVTNAGLVHLKGLTKLTSPLEVALKIEDAELKRMAERQRTAGFVARKCEAIT